MKLNNRPHQRHGQDLINKMGKAYERRRQVKPTPEELETFVFYLSDRDFMKIMVNEDKPFFFYRRMDFIFFDLLIFFRNRFSFVAWSLCFLSLFLTAIVVGNDVLHSFAIFLLVFLCCQGVIWDIYPARKLFKRRFNGGKN